MKRMPSDNADDSHCFFADYLQMKIEDGGFPRGCVMPSSAEFMSIFKIEPHAVAKAISELEDIHLVKIERGSAKVVAGRSAKESKSIDVIEDISNVLNEFEILENRALENAWPYLNKKMAKSFLEQETCNSPSQRIQKLNATLHSWAIGNCEDMEVCRRLDIAYRRARFFMQAYADSSNSDDVRANALVGESVICSIASDDLSKTCSRFSKYLENVRCSLHQIFFRRMENYIKGASAL